MRLSLGFSPCPNDTFIFDAMIHGKVDTQGLSFEVVLLDVEELNKKAFAEELAITKLSFHAFAYLTEIYQLLDAGSALGNGVGPLLVANNVLSEDTINQAHIGIPGKNTTANFLLSLAYPQAQNKTEMLFSDIENAILNGAIDAGLIIHENRFTYEDKGLVKIIDLGEFWENSTNMPIPLGGIAIKRNLPLNIKQKVNQVMKDSVAYAFANPISSRNFIKQHAQEMDEMVQQKHIDLYVNDYSADLGPKGKAAIQKLFNMAVKKGLISEFDNEIFLR